MNIFENRDIFFGKPNFASIRGNMDEFWKLANEIKSELGEEGYYLDRYLSVIFDTLADIDLNTATIIADNMCSSIIKNCYIIFEDKQEHEKNEFFEIVKNYVDRHPVNFKESHTKVEYYAGKIIIENLEMLIKEFKKRYLDRILGRIDYLVALELFKKITSIICKDKMENFNYVMTKSFVFGPINISILQQFVAHSIGTFLYRDSESSKQIYQHIIGNKELIK